MLTPANWRMAMYTAQAGINTDGRSFLRGCLCRQAEVIYAQPLYPKSADQNL